VCEYEVNQLANGTVIRGKRNFTQLINDAGRRKNDAFIFSEVHIYFILINVSFIKTNFKPFPGTYTYISCH